MSLTDEEIRRLQQLWRELRFRADVVRAAGVTRETADRYRPRDVPRIKKNKHRLGLVSRIRKAWRECATADEVAQLVGCTLSAAINMRPRKSPSARTGYRSWSTAVQLRWDALWRHITSEHLARLARLMELAKRHD